MQIEIKRIFQHDLKNGDLLYHNHELLRVTRIGKERKDGSTTFKFRRIGKVNLDRVFWPKPASTENG